VLAAESVLLCNAAAAAAAQMQDVEDQATAGLDLMMADALADVTNATHLQETQVRLQETADSLALLAQQAI
jgi:hypothetical protein